MRLRGVLRLKVWHATLTGVVMHPSEIFCFSSGLAIFAEPIKALWYASHRKKSGVNQLRLEYVQRVKVLHATRLGVGIRPATEVLLQ